MVVAGSLGKNFLRIMLATVLELLMIGQLDTRALLRIRGLSSAPYLLWWRSQRMNLSLCILMCGCIIFFNWQECSLQSVCTLDFMSVNERI